MKNKIVLLLILAFAVLQLFTIDKVAYKEPTSTDLIEVEQVPEQIAKILKKSCYNCHSDQVEYPWYSNIAPVSWWIQDHIEEGREHLNFSSWGEYPSPKKEHKAEEAHEEVEEGEMPLESYTFIHGEADLNDEERELLIDWFKQLEAKYK